jgi:hypothetical protein
MESENDKPNATVSIASISDIIATKLKHRLTREQFRYRVNRTPTDKTTDIFDGSAYKALVEDGFFENEHDVAIGLSMDGFVPFNNSPFKANMVQMVIYNIDPKER